MCGCGTEEKTNTAKGIVRINFKEDFELVVELLAGDKPYKLGDEDFRIDFIVMASRYTVGRTGGVCERCSVDGNKIRCFMDGHGLPPGELRAEVKVNTLDPNYADGSRLNVAMAEGTVVLVKDNTRFDGAVVKAAMSVALIDAYKLAKAHGYKGTIDEYYSTFSDVSALLESMRGVVEAEEARKVAEEERVKAEELRQKNRVVVDSELSETSENALQNKMITGTLNEHTKQFNAIRNSLAVLWGQTLYGWKSSTDGAKAPEGVTDIVLPRSVTSIEEIAFSGCSSLASINIPDSVTSIGDGAFVECTSLESITIPNSVTSIGKNAFYGCSSLASITYKGTMKQWGEIDKPVDWNLKAKADAVIHCTDGDIKL